jgi:hypothetical protein
MLFACSACCLTLTPPPAGAGEPDPAALTATTILGRMAKVYAGCKTYRDTGVATTVPVGDAPGETERIEFTTAFVRPDRLRFVFQGGSPDRETGGIVWCNGGDVRWQFLGGGVKTEDPLVKALFAAVAESMSTSSYVPDLLTAKRGDGMHMGALSGLTDPERLGDAGHDGAQCFRVQFLPNGVAEHRTTLWIEQKSFLLRRVDERFRYPDFCAEQTTTYTPVLDEEIADALLEFRPPGSSPADLGRRWWTSALFAGAVVLVLAMRSRGA